MCNSRSYTEWPHISPRQLSQQQQQQLQESSNMTIIPIEVSLIRFVNRVFVKRLLLSSWDKMQDLGQQLAQTCAEWIDKLVQWSHMTESKMSRNDAGSHDDATIVSNPITTTSQILALVIDNCSSTLQQPDINQNSNSDYALCSIENNRTNSVPTLYQLYNASMILIYVMQAISSCKQNFHWNVIALTLLAQALNFMAWCSINKWMWGHVSCRIQPSYRMSTTTKSPLVDSMLSIVTDFVALYVLLILSQCPPETTILPILGIVAQTVWYITVISNHFYIAMVLRKFQLMFNNVNLKQELDCQTSKPTTFHTYSLVLMERLIAVGHIVFVTLITIGLVLALDADYQRSVSWTRIRRATAQVSLLFLFRSMYSTYNVFYTLCQQYNGPH